MFGHDPYKVFASARRLFVRGQIVLALASAPVPSWAASTLPADPSVVDTLIHETLHHSMLLAATLGLILVLSLLGFMYVRLRASTRRTIEAKQQLKAAIENISDGFAIYDADDRLVMCNEQLRKMYPTIADRLVPGVKCADMARALYQSGALAPSFINSSEDQSVASLTCKTNDTEVQLRDGRWILHRDRRLPDGGKVGVRTDITEIKKRETRLQDSAARYRNMVERLPVPIYVHRDGVVLYANTATADILGFSSADDLIGKNVLDMIHPDHHKLAIRRQTQAQQNATPLGQVDMKYVRCDGATLYTESHISPALYDGKPALESILYDISARRRTERALMESEQRYRNLFELSPDAILVHDGGHILFANETAAQMLGAASDTSLFGTSIAQLFDAPTSANLLSVNGSAPNAAPRVLTCQLKRLNDEIFDAEIVVAHTHYHGQRVHQAVIRDITDRKRMDASIVQNAKLASLGRMAAGLAHELSQPLNIMRFAAEGGMLKMSKNTINDDQHARNYQLIQDQAERMASVMDNMRIFSRNDPGPMQAFDLTLAVHNISHLVRNPFRVDDVHIEWLGPASGIKTHGNAIQLEQVLLNLLNNARDSILDHRRQSNDDEPGRITIDCQASPKWDEAVVTVSDNGGGISPQDLERIFDPFYTTKDVGQGTGLGLALSHEIITAMAGTITAHNTDDGACFTIHLPLIEVTQPSLQPTADGTASAMNTPFDDITAQHDAIVMPASVRHILVVEDEVEAAAALANFLRDEGFKVSVAHNGREGLNTYRALRPDVVITDIRMPGMDGASLIQALRSERADLPIIAVTGHMGETEHLEVGPGLAPVKIMKKPVSLMAIYREIGDICAP